MPRTDIDYNLVKELAEIQTPEKEIAIAVHMTPPAFSARKQKDLELVEALWQGKCLGKQKLRQKLYSEATEGNTPALIHASKHWLGMNDKIEVSGNEEHPINIKVDYTKLKDDDLRAIESIFARTRSEGSEEGTSKETST